MKKLVLLAPVLMLAFSLAACGNNGGASPGGDAVPSPAADTLPNGNGSGGITPYLSITARREISGAEEYMWDEVYYVYDLAANELREVCVLPHFSGYTAGVVSLWDDTVYFSMRESDRSNDRICRYDIQSGEMSFIENENTSYNDFTLLDQNTLLLIASTYEHTITPALFDLNSGTFTYMADANGESFDLYTAGGQLLNYNYLFDTFPWLYFKLTDRYSDGYTGHEEAIDYNFAAVSTDLKKPTI